MRLSLIFLVVLAGSAILTSMAAWGITYGTSYDKVSTMAVEFTGLAQANLKTFGSFVSDLLSGNAALVDDILARERRAAQNGTEQTKAATSHTIGVLVNYTTNATVQTQQQMNTVVDTFGTLMNTVVTDFRGLASGYAAQVRNDLAAQVSNVLFTAGNQAASVMRRLQKLLDVGLLDLSRAPTGPVGDTDCTLLSIICDGTEDFNSDFTLAAATGRRYGCGPTNGATLSAISAGGGTYNETFLQWPPASPGSLPMKQRCLTGAAAVQPVGLNCPLPQGCQCGADPRCAPWYELQANTTVYHFSSNVYYDQAGIPTLHMSMPLFNSSANPPVLLGVIDAALGLFGLDYYLATLAGFSSGTSLAILLNDTDLTAIASHARPCAGNAPPPGDPALPTRSGFRSCDPGLRAVAQWLADHRALTAMFTMEDSGLVWNVFPSHTAVISFFFVVGTNRTQADQPIDTSVARADTQLATVRTQLLGQVAASGQATQAYMAAVGADNIAATQAMQDSLLADIAMLENASRVSLAVSREDSSANVRQVTASQASAVEARKVSYLNDMSTTSGWTIAVVFAILLVVLLLSAWGTFRVTSALTNIISLMEDVADMKVEDLEVPQRSGVREVARIQTAFQVLVRRLAEYKSYIPAGLFEKEQLEGDRKGSQSSADVYESDQPSSAMRGSSARFSRSTADGLKAISRPATACSRADVVLVGKRSGSVGVSQLPLPPRLAVKRNAAVMSVNVKGFMDVMLNTNDGLSKGLFNDYVSRVHESVSQGRGNIDCILGDQIFVTFNAHIPCADPAGAAAAVALDMRGQLLVKMGDRLKFQIGLAFGPVFASSVGYAKFKSMVTLGSPMKLAFLQAHMAGFETGTILADSNLEERLKYTFTFRPADLVHLPELKSFAKMEATSHRVFFLLNKKNLLEDEWLYQVEDMASLSDWNQTFDHLVAASTVTEARELLLRYLAACPCDEAALRLKDRIALWIPGAGVPL